MFSRNNLCRIKDGAYVIYLVHKLNKGKPELVFIIYWQKYNCIHWFFWNSVYPEEILYKIKDKLITHNTFGIQDNDCSVDFIVSFS